MQNKSLIWVFPTKTVLDNYMAPNNIETTKKAAEGRWYLLPSSEKKCHFANKPL